MKRSRLKPGKPLLTRSVLRRTELKAKPKPEARELTATRKVVAKRSGGRCEIRAAPGCTGVGTSVHHRLRRSQGRDDRPVNLLHACVYCDSLIHANPELAYRRGWMVRSFERPEDVPVLIGLPGVEFSDGSR